MRNFYLLTILEIIDAKFAHFSWKICAFFQFNVWNRASRGPNPITGGINGGCGSPNCGRIGRRAVGVKNGNAGPKLHWRLWERRGFLALPSDWEFSAKNDYPYGPLGVETQLFLAYCLHFRPIFKERQRKVGFAPIDFNAEVGPALPFAICRENGDAMYKYTGISGPASFHDPGEQLSLHYPRINGKSFSSYAQWSQNHEDVFFSGPRGFRL